jgi:hypothetical protein
MLLVYVQYSVLFGLPVDDLTSNADFHQPQPSGSPAVCT